MASAIHWHESAMDLHVFPIPIPPPTSLSTRSLWVFKVHQVQALVSCIQHGLVICFTLDNIHVSMLFSLNIPPAVFYMFLIPTSASASGKHCVHYYHYYFFYCGLVLPRLKLYINQLYSMYSFESGFIQCLWNSPVLWYVTAAHSFMVPNSSLNEYHSRHW